MLIPRNVGIKNWSAEEEFRCAPIFKVYFYAYQSSEGMSTIFPCALRR